MTTGQEFLRVCTISIELSKSKYNARQCLPMFEPGDCERRLLVFQMLLLQCTQITSYALAKRPPRCRRTKTSSFERLRARTQEPCIRRSHLRNRSSFQLFALSQLTSVVCVFSPRPPSRFMLIMSIPGTALMECNLEILLDITSRRLFCRCASTPIKAAHHRGCLPICI